jgi:hypothetical protein
MSKDHPSAAWVDPDYSPKIPKSWIARGRPREVLRLAQRSLRMAKEAESLRSKNSQTLRMTRGPENDKGQSAFIQLTLKLT